MRSFFLPLRARQTIAFVISLVILLLVLDELNAPSHALSEQAIVKQAIMVSVIKAEPLSTLPKLEKLGYVEPVKLTQITSQVQGEIIAIANHFKKGRLLKPQQHLLTIDPLAYQVALAEAQAGVLQAEVELKNAIIRFSAKSMLVKLAKSQLALAQSRLMQAKEQLQQTKIRQPFAGEITKIQANLGEFISLGQSIALALPKKDQEIRVLLSELDFALIDVAINKKLTVFSLDKKRQWQAKVIGVSQHSDNLQRAIYLQIGKQAKNPPLYGQHVYVQLPVSAWQSNAVLPQSCLTLQGNIWLIDGNNRLLKTKLKDSVLIDDNVYFSLPDADLSRVALFPLTSFSQGMTVLPREINSSESASEFKQDRSPL